MRRHLEGIRSGDDGHEWHVQNGDGRARPPHFEIQAVEPILLLRARVDDKEPKAEFFEMGDPRTGRTVRCEIEFRLGTTKRPTHISRAQATERQKYKGIMAFLWASVHN
jgi:hypothetical protein